MKKIISLVVVATMLFTLFAVNVSAAVTTTAVMTDLVPAEDFADTPESTWLEGQVRHESEKVPTGALADDTALDSQVLEITIGDKQNPENANNGDKAVIGMSYDGTVVYPQKYEITFKFKRVQATNTTGIGVYIPDTAFDGGKGGTVVVGGGNFTTGNWYDCRIIVDKSQTNPCSVSVKDITNNGAWTAVTFDSSYDGKGRFLTGDWCSNLLNSGRGPAFVTATLFSHATGDVYRVDDFAVKAYNTPVIDGVYLADDFESGNKFHVGIGSANIVADANGNNYAKLAGAYFNVELDHANAVTLPSKDSYVLEFDMYSPKEGASIELQVRHADGGFIYKVLNIPTDGWYTYRMSNGGASATVGSGSAGGLYIARAAKGTNNWTKLGVFSDPDKVGYLDKADYGSSGTIALISFGDDTNEIWVDNVTISELESTSFMAAKDENDVLNATFSFAGIRAFNGVYTSIPTPATLAAVLATFDGGVLVDVDYSAVTNVCGTINAELSADATDADEAYIYVWDGIGTAKPMMTEALNLSSYLQ